MLGTSRTGWAGRGGSGRDRLPFGRTRDTIAGGADAIDLSAATANTTVDLGLGTVIGGGFGGDHFTSIEIVAGSNKAALIDIVFGSSAAELIFLQGGNDEAEGGGGADGISGGAGSDRLDGGLACKLRAYINVGN